MIEVGDFLLETHEGFITLHEIIDSGGALTSKRIDVFYNKTTVGIYKRGPGLVSCDKYISLEADYGKKLWNNFTKLCYGLYMFFYKDSGLYISKKNFEIGITIYNFFNDSFFEGVVMVIKTNTVGMFPIQLSNRRWHLLIRKYNTCYHYLKKLVENILK